MGPLRHRLRLKHVSEWARRAGIRGLWVLGASFLLWSLSDRLTHASGYAASWDAVDFVLALDRFDLLAMQPHFPGYPYFILGGMAVRRIVGNPVEALAILNALALFTASVPIYALARRYCGALPAMLATAVLQTMPYLWVLGTQPMSEGVGVALVWWYVWFVVRAGERLTIRSQLAAVLAFGIICGVRVSFFPVGIGLAWVWLRDWRVHRSFLRLAVYAGVLAAVQLLWVSVLLLSEGSVSGFAELAKGFVAGHFNEWGGGVAANPMGWEERINRFLAVNGLWTAVLGQSTIMGWVWGITAGAAVFAGVWTVSADHKPARTSYPLSSACTALVALMAAFYGLWAWFGQNIDKPRHIVPFALLVVFVLMMGALRRLSLPASLAGLTILLVAQTAAGSAIVRQQAAETPAVYQLHRELARLQGSGGGPFVVYTWEETRVLQFLQAEYPHKRIHTYSFFLAEAAALEGQRIFLTGKVLEGFKAQGMEPEGWVKKVSEFRSSALYEPVYHHIELYEWIHRPPK